MGSIPAGNSEKQRKIDSIFPENSRRARAQEERPIRVIVGNPPYNVAKGVSYPALEAAIRRRYATATGAVNKNSLYDSYIKAFRWASDRIGPEGIVAFISNGGWIDAAAMSGFRASIQKEFSEIYVFNLRGNCRTSGELRKREGDGIFGLGSRTPIAITILVKTAPGGAGGPPAISPHFHVRPRFELFSEGADENFLGNSVLECPEMGEMACSVDLPY